MVAPVPAIRCRQIGEADIAAVARLLARGFPNRGRRFWLHALQRLTGHEPPPGLPKYGYLLETGGDPVGAILLIFSTMREGDQIATRCNLSSWYVEPAFRTYATLLVSQALRHKDVTYLNVSAGAAHLADHRGAGLFALLRRRFHRHADPARTFQGAGRESFRRRPNSPTVAFDPFDREILSQHAAHGCISLWCATAERAYPFVFRPRLVKSLLPCAQMIYCDDIADFVRFAGPIGRYLARHGKPFVIVDSNGADSRTARHIFSAAA